MEVYKKLKATGNCKKTGIQVDEAEHRVVMHLPYKGWHSFSKTFIHMMDQASTWKDHIQFSIKDINIWQERTFALVIYRISKGDIAQKLICGFLLISHVAMNLFVWSRSGI